MPNAALRAAIGQREPSTRYIYDRCNGSSVYRDEARRPCCYICYVPPPVYAFSDTCEQNGLCECIGRIGCCGQKSQKMRSGIFTVVLLLNFYALALSVFANLAASDAITLLERSNFAQGVVYFQTNQAIVTVRAYMGLEYVAIRDVAGILGTRNYHNNNSSSSLSTMAAAATTNSNGESIYTWDDFCGNFTTTTTSNNNADANDVVPSSIIEPFVDLAACQECAETSGNIQRLFAFCNLALIILIATNVLRRFPNYDVRVCVCVEKKGHSWPTPCWFCIHNSPSTWSIFNNVCVFVYYLLHIHRSIVKKPGHYWHRQALRYVVVGHGIPMIATALMSCFDPTTIWQCQIRPTRILSELRRPWLGKQGRP